MLNISKQDTTCSSLTVGIKFVHFAFMRRGYRFTFPLDAQRHLLASAHALGLNFNQLLDLLFSHLRRWLKNPANVAAGWLKV